MHITIIHLLLLIKHINVLFYIPNHTQYLNITPLLTINKQQIRNLLREKSLLIVNKCYQINNIH